MKPCAILLHDHAANYNLVSALILIQATPKKCVVSDSLSARVTSILERLEQSCEIRYGRFTYAVDPGGDFCFIVDLVLQRVLNRLRINKKRR